MSGIEDDAVTENGTTTEASLLQQQVGLFGVDFKSILLANAEELMQLAEEIDYGRGVDGKIIDPL